MFNIRIRHDDINSIPNLILAVPTLGLALGDNLALDSGIGN